MAVRDDRGRWLGVVRSRFARNSLAILNARRARLALLTGAVSSVGNLSLSVVVARNGSIDELGQFAIASAMYVLVTGLARAAVTDSALAQKPDARLLRMSARRVSAVGALAAVVMVVVGLLFGSGYLIVGALALPGMVLYDYVKAVDIGVATARRACAQEAVWTAVTGVAVLLGLSRQAGPLVVFAVWAASGALIGYVSAELLGYPLLPGWPVAAGETRTAMIFGVDFLVGSGTAQVAMTVLAGAAGMAVVGSVSAAKTVLGPVTLLMGTASLLIVPYLARTGSAEPGARLRSARGVTGLMLTLVGPLALALSVLPDAVGTTALGANWDAARPLLPILAAECVLSTVAMVAFAGHRVQRAGSRTLLIRMLTGPARVAAVVGPGLALGARGVALGMAVMALVGAFIWWWSYFSLLRREERNQCLRESV